MRIWSVDVILRTFTFPVVFLFAASLSGEMLEPPYDIPSAIARPAEVSDFEGEWRRMDRQYELEISDVNSEEGPTAVYRNPDPVKVESAEWIEDDGVPAIRVTLRDEGYPGSFYVLRFLPERQVLLGTYQRPGAEVSNVYFLREEDAEN
ncbi:MAG: hypothetical protein AAGJ81_09675 [Verrucomicrobiota bacterium]